MRGLQAVLLMLVLPSLVWAQGVLGPAANPNDAVLYDYRSVVELQDDFMGGNNNSATIGELGWLFSGGTATILAPEAGRPGIFQRNTSATISTAAYTFLNLATRTMLGTDRFSLLYVARLSQVDANTKVRIGVQNASTDPSNAGIYFERLDADTNWFCVTRSASVETRVDTGVAATAAVWAKLRFDRTPAGVQFYVNETPVCGLMATNVPGAVGLFPSMLLINSAAAAKTMDLDYFQLRITGLTR